MVKERLKSRIGIVMNKNNEIQMEKLLVSRQAKLNATALIRRKNNLSLTYNINSKWLAA